VATETVIESEQAFLRTLNANTPTNEQFIRVRAYGVEYMNHSAPHGLREPESYLLTKAEFKTLLAYAAGERKRTRSKLGRWKSYERLKRQLDKICGWSCRDPQMGPQHWEAGVRMLCQKLGV
jgi:hypothetical protein